jgi:hypothetical protein
LHVSRRCLVTACAFVSPSHAVCYPLWAICGRGLGYSASAVQSSRIRVCGLPLGWFLEERPPLVLHAVRFLSSKHFLETSPLRNGRSFWHSAARQD